MLLRLKIVSISMNASASFETEDEAPPQSPKQPQSPPPKRRLASRQTFYFSVYPADRDHLDLETGEVFKHPNFGRTRRKPEKPEKDTSISAQLSVYEAKKQSDLAHNRMQYFGEVKTDEDYNPSSISFTFCLPPRGFQNLETNIQNGVLPSTVVIGLEHPLFDSKSHPLSYGWELDGSGMKWRNKADEDQHVKIESISFGYEILKPALDDNTGLTIEREVTSPIELANQHAKELKDILLRVLTEIKHVGWIIIGAAFLLAFLLRR
jgi:hypothetical protein